MKVVTNYKRVSEELPPEGIIVETVSPDGMVQNLKRQGQLWFGGVMYVYYTPEFWRPL